MSSIWLWWGVARVVVAPLIWLTEHNSHIRRGHNTPIIATSSWHRCVLMHTAPYVEVFSKSYLSNSVITTSRRSVRKTRGKWNVGQFGLEVNVRRASCAPFLQSFHPLVLTLQAWWSSFSHKSSNGNFAFPFDLSCIWCTWLVSCVLLNPQSEPFAISLVCMKVFVCAYISMCHYLTEIDNCCNRS